jgi:hypothetical protein
MKNFRESFALTSCLRSSTIPVGKIGLERDLRFEIELDREEDGRWIAEIPSLPGVLVYGKSKLDAVAKVKALALRVLANQIC